jgi:RNA polymerase sigma-70 factor (ECF subfamily)
VSVDHELVERILAEGRAAWPAVVIEPAALRESLAGRELGDPERLSAAELYLAVACARGDAAALAAFDQRYLSQVPRFVSRIDSAPSFADELKQTVRALLFVGAGLGEAPKILTYSGRGPLEGWVRVVTIHAALKLKKDDGRLVPGAEPAEHEPSPGADPEIGYLKAHYRQEFEQALERGVKALAVEERNTLRLYFLDGLSVVQIGAIQQVHASTVSRRLATARKALLVEVQKALREQLKVSPSELESVLRLLQSQMDVSLRSMFQEST